MVALMFWRRWISGIYPLLVWAQDEEAADVTAVVHAALLRDRIHAAMFVSWRPVPREDAS